MENWPIGKSVVDCLEYALQGRHLTDVEFRFADEKPVVTVGAHRLILSLRSPIFEAMFYGSLVGESVKVEITDIQSSAFKEMLRFMYTDHVDLTEKDATELLRASHKYCIPDLMGKCSQFLINTINKANVCELLENATMCEVKDLQHSCIVYIDNYAEKVFKRKDFLRLSHYNLKRLLSANTLQADENTIYKAVLAWVEAECNRRSLDFTAFQNRRGMAGPLVALIRFPLIPAKTFSEEIAGSPFSLLSPDETIQVFHEMFAVRCDNAKDTMCMPRKSDVTLEVSRFRQAKSRCRFWCHEIEDKFQFTCNMDLVLIGVILKDSLQRCGCSGIIRGSVQILDDSSSKPILLCEKSLIHKQSPPPPAEHARETLHNIQLDFHPSIFITPYKRYGVHLRVKQNLDDCECNEVCDCYDLVCSWHPMEEFRDGQTVITFKNTGEAIVKTLLFNHWR